MCSIGGSTAGVEVKNTLMRESPLIRLSRGRSFWEHSALSSRSKIPVLLLSCPISGMEATKMKRDHLLGYYFLTICVSILSASSIAIFKASLILNKATLRVLSDAGLAKIGS